MSSTTEAGATRSFDKKLIRYTRRYHKLASLTQAKVLLLFRGMASATEVKTAWGQK